jgi:hypothetical protein
MGVLSLADTRPTTSRQTLRRRIARLLKEPFFEYVPDGYIAPTDNGGTGYAVIGTGYDDLFPEDGMWKRNFLLVIHADGTTEERRITSYTAANGRIEVQPALSTATLTTDTLEIHSRTSATRKHEAINWALENAYPHFWQEEYWRLCIPEGYGRLTSAEHLPTDWKKVNSIWLEPALQQSGPYTATSVTTTTLTDSTQNWAVNQWAGYEAALVRGEGVGQIGTILSNTATTLTLTAAISALVGTHLPRFYLKRPETLGTSLTLEASQAWIQVADAMVDHDPFTHLYIGEWVQACEGRTLILSGLKPPSPLTTESGTTPLPADYVMYQAASILDIGQAHQAGADHEGTRFAGRWYAQEAERLRRQKAWQPPVGTKFRPPTSRFGGVGISVRDGNPFDWS